MIQLLLTAVSWSQHLLLWQFSFFILILRIPLLPPACLILIMNYRSYYCWSYQLFTDKRKRPKRPKPLQISRRAAQLVDRKDLQSWLGKESNNQNGNLRWHLPWRGGVSSATYLFWNIARIVNAVQVTIWLLVSTLNIMIRVSQFVRNSQ